MCDSAVRRRRAICSLRERDISSIRYDLRHDKFRQGEIYLFHILFCLRIIISSGILVSVTPNLIIAICFANT